MRTVHNIQEVETMEDMAGNMSRIYAALDNKQEEYQSMIQLDIGGHPPIPTGSSCPFFIQHVFLYCFIIVSSTLLGMSEASHILQVDTGGLSPNPTGLFCMFSCQHILLYF
jgi:hypothetical protein